MEASIKILNHFCNVMNFSCFRHLQHVQCGSIMHTLWLYNVFCCVLFLLLLSRNYVNSIEWLYAALQVCTIWWTVDSSSISTPRFFLPLWLPVCCDHQVFDDFYFCILDPIMRNSVLSLFNFSWLSNINFLSSELHRGKVDWLYH